MYINFSHGYYDVKEDDFIIASFATHEEALKYIKEHVTP